MEELTDAVRAMPFRTRADAMLNVLAEGLDDGEALVQSLRTDASLVPTAVSVLVRRGLLDPDDLTEAESLLMVTESLLQLLETAGPEGMSEVLRDQGLPAEEALAAALVSDHPDQAGIAELQAAAEHTLPNPGSGISRARTRRQHGKGRKKGQRRR